MESRLRHTVETDVLEGALNIAVDKGLSQSQTFKPSDGRVIFMDCFFSFDIFHFFLWFAIVSHSFVTLFAYM